MAESFLKRTTLQKFTRKKKGSKFVDYGRNFAMDVQKQERTISVPRVSTPYIACGDLQKGQFTVDLLFGQSW